MEQRRTEEQAAQEELEEVSKAQDKILNKRTMLTDTVAQKQHMIRELGKLPTHPMNSINPHYQPTSEHTLPIHLSTRPINTPYQHPRITSLSTPAINPGTLPRKELEEFKTLGEKQVLKKLKEVNENLKKYASVNRKALDQYVSFNEQRENLVSRKDELTRDTTAIEQLVTSLDAQKEEAILRTFRGVSHHFSEVFAELVPGGQGKLIMKTSNDGNTLTHTR